MYKNNSIQQFIEVYLHKTQLMCNWNTKYN